VHASVHGQLPDHAHRCPVGSHAPVTPAWPALADAVSGPAQSSPRTHALQRNVLRARTPEPWLHTSTRLLEIGQIVSTTAFATVTAAHSLVGWASAHQPRNAARHAWVHGSI
jgi:hypothetical protein